jgi:hypothetical protein
MKKRFRIGKLLLSAAPGGDVVSIYRKVSIYRHNRWLRFTFQLDSGDGEVNFQRQPCNIIQAMKDYGRCRRTGRMF